jgi:hypothetical protein
MSGRLLLAFVVAVPIAGCAGDPWEVRGPDDAALDPLRAFKTQIDEVNGRRPERPEYREFAELNRGADLRRRSLAEWEAPDIPERGVERLGQEDRRGGGRLLDARPERQDRPVRSLTGHRASRALGRDPSL